MKSSKPNNKAIQPLITIKPTLAKGKVKEFTKAIDIGKYAQRRDRHLKLDEFTKRILVKHGDGSILNFAYAQYELVRDTEWECTVLGGNLMVKEIIKGEDVHIVYTEHHGIHVYYSSDLMEDQEKNGLKITEMR